MVVQMKLQWRKLTREEKKTTTHKTSIHTSRILMHQVKTMASAFEKAEPFSLFEAFTKHFTEHVSHSYVEEGVKVNVCLPLSKERVHMCVNLCVFTIKISTE